MTPDEGRRLAERTLAKIDPWENSPYVGGDRRQYTADRERVESDLAGLQDHEPTQFANWVACVQCLEQNEAYVAADRVPWPCPDAQRYSDGLRRTAALYGVVE